MKRSIKYLGDMKPRIALCVSAKTTASIMELTLPWLLATTIDDIAPTKDVPKVVLFGVLMILCAIITIWGNLTCNQVAARISRDTVEGLRNDVYKKVFDMNISQLDRVTISSAISRLTTDIQNVQLLVSTVLRMGIRAPILLVGGLIFTISMDFRLSKILFLILQFIAVAAVVTTRKGAKFNREIQSASDDIVNVTRDSVSGMLEVKGFNTEKKEAERFEEISKVLKQKEMKTARLMSILNPSINFLLNTGTVFVVLYGAFLAKDGLSETGDIIAFLSYFTLISGALLSVNRLFMMISRGMASSARIEEILFLPKEKPNTFDDEGEHNSNYIVFENVSFGYPRSARVLKNISFQLKKGETLGIIGATGAGKSTLINLLQSFYKPNEGAIFIDNINTATMYEKEVHEKFGVVMQNDCVFSDTIAGNVRLGRNVSDKNILKALEIADLGKFVEGKEEGIEYIIQSNGKNLSGGQKQRLLIARAIALEPEILILDDSSSALDYSTDAKIRKAIAKETNCTTVIIAQRITSLMSCDKILFIGNRGEQIGLGTHKELMESCETYLEMWNVQTGGAKYEI